jgi:hypothetical protein
LPSIFAVKIGKPLWIWRGTVARSADTQGANTIAKAGTRQSAVPELRPDMNAVPGRGSDLNVPVPYPAFQQIRTKSGNALLSVLSKLSCRTAISDIIAEPVMTVAACHLAYGCSCGKMTA